MDKWFIEKRWSYKGYDCIVTYTETETMAWRCGYVVIGKTKGINTESIKCHGGITCAEHHYKLNEFVIGFDCAHWGDSTDVCTLDYCISECESIVEQILEVTKNG